jgi:N,N'-diacetyllegionaminate synthase
MLGISMKPRTFIIAEAGVNHNGRLDLALQLCDLAQKAGADAVKFQTFKTEKLLTKKVKMAEYQEKAVGQAADSQYEMIKKLELDFEAFKIIKNHCDTIGIEFMSTPDDEDSLEFLVQLGVKRLKIGSPEITNIPYLRKFAKTGLPLIVSTGMANLDEVQIAYNTLVAAGTPPEKLTFLHCNSEYPSPFEDVNLRAMLTIQKTLGTPVGYSDHTLGISIALATVALGGTVIEKHFTLDKMMEGPDHKASLDFVELKAMVQGIRQIEMGLGRAEKIPSPSEAKNKELVRRFIVAKREIRRGEVLTDENMTTKRTDGGISSALWDSVLNKVASRDYDEDESVVEE